MARFKTLVELPRSGAAVGLAFLAFLASQARGQIGTGPIILVQPLDVSVDQGDLAIISATVAPSLTPQKFYWFLNGQPVVTNASIVLSNTTTLDLDIVSALVIGNADPTNAGSYSLRITNGVGFAVSSSADLSVVPSMTTNAIYFVTSGIQLTLGGFQIQLIGPSGSNFVIEASSDLANWVPISTNSAPSGTVSYVDPSAKTNAIRFYRALLQ